MNRKLLSWMVLVVFCFPAILLLHRLLQSCNSIQTASTARFDTARSERSILTEPPPNQEKSPEPGSLKSARTTRETSTVVGEALLLQAARNELDQNPQTALQFIRRADRLYGEHNDDRRHLEIEAQVRLGKVGHARALADQFYRAFPESSKVGDIERLTGYHPRPYGP